MIVKEYPNIPPLLKVEEQRKMTVQELIQALQEYPSDSPVRINIEQEPRQLLEIKEVSPVVDMDTNRANPVLFISKIKAQKV